MTEVLAFDRYAHNGGLIQAAANLGYLEGRVLDAAYGVGTFWKGVDRVNLWGLDRIWYKAPHVQGDFTALPFRARSFASTVLDGPYKLNGTPDEAVDARYGVDVPSTWQARMDLIARGIRECARVTDRYLLVKCQDQVSSGHVRWQTRVFADVAEDVGFRLVDSLFFLGGRAQPDGTSQVHARRNASTLLVLERGKILSTGVDEV